MRKLLPLLLIALAAHAQTPAKTEPDILILSDGEKLIGHLVRSGGATVRFKSDVLGEVTVDWSKIQELRSSGAFAVVTKDLKRGAKAATSDVAQGPVSMTNQKLEVATAAGPKTIPVADAENVVDVGAFNKAFEHRSLLKGWAGTVTAGASFVESTQNSRSFNESVSLARVSPAVDWLARRNRTSFDFSSSYGLLSQPNTPSIKTSIYHGDAERDEYFSPAVFAYGQAQFDHNFSQGLDLQQTYVGGVGWSVFKRANEGLDLKGGISFVEQQFAGATKSQSLAGSVFDEKYLRKFGKGIVFTQEFSVSPAWTNSKALSAYGNAGLAIPVYKRLTFTMGAIDNFLNDPPGGFKRNSFQFTTGLTYVLQ